MASRYLMLFEMNEVKIKCDFCGKKVVQDYLFSIFRLRGCEECRKETEEYMRKKGLIKTLRRK